MSVRRRNKRLQQESKINHIPTYNDRGEFVGFREELKEPAMFADPMAHKRQQIMNLERDRLKHISAEQKKVDYVLRMKRYGFKMGKAHKA